MDHPTLDKKTSATSALSRWLDQIEQNRFREAEWINYDFWNTCNVLRDEEHSHQIRNYISAACSRPNNDTVTIFCNDLIRNYIICHMCLLVKDKYSEKLTTWSDGLSNSLIRRMEKAFE